MEKENNILNTKIDKLESDLSAIKMFNVELETKVEKEKEESETNKVKKEFLQRQLSQIKAKLDQIKISLNDKDDTVKVLENIVKNRELEILDLKKMIQLKQLILVLSVISLLRLRKI